MIRLNCRRWRCLPSALQRIRPHLPSSKSTPAATIPAQALSNSVLLSIVAVHGLGGDAINTWTHAKSNKFWLKDFLPRQIPDARIMTFGYNAAAAFGQSTAEVTDHAKSLLSSLVDKRDEPEVDTSRGLKLNVKKRIDERAGERPSLDIYCAFSRRHRGKTGEAVGGPKLGVNFLCS